MTQHYSMPSRGPLDFELYGSNNGSDWTLVDSVTGEAAFGNDEWRTYTVDSPGAYEYYKFNVSAWYGSDIYGGIREIELHGVIAAAPEVIGTDPPDNCDLGRDWRHELDAARRDELGGGWVYQR